MKKCLIASLAALVLTLPAADGNADDKKDKKDDLRGTWRFVGADAMGFHIPEEYLEGCVVTFEAGTLTGKLNDTKYARDLCWSKGTYKADASKSPAELDVMPTEGKGKGKTLKMIYRLKGDSLTLGTFEKGEKRPKTFANNEVLIIRLKREKK
jgi:uncharacterized protein (TIGR03067 family)